MRSSLPTKDHTLAYNVALASAKSGSGPTDDTASKEERALFRFSRGVLGELCHGASFTRAKFPLDEGYCNPAVERTSPRRRTFADPDIADIGKVKWLPTLNRYRSVYASDHNQPERASSRQERSHSADVSFLRRDSMWNPRWNERCVNFADHSRLISYRWMPETGISMSRYLPSPLARRTSEGDRYRPSTSVRWMTYARNPSPCPIQRKLSDRRSSGSDQTSLPSKSDESRDSRRKGDEESKEDRDKEDEERKRGELKSWQPLRKFAPAASTLGQIKSCAPGVVYMESIKTH